jgi:hypothetical protein
MRAYGPSFRELVLVLISFIAFKLEDIKLCLLPFWVACTDRSAIVYHHLVGLSARVPWELVVGQAKAQLFKLVVSTVTLVIIRFSLKFLYKGWLVWTVRSDFKTTLKPKEYRGELRFDTDGPYLRVALRDGTIVHVRGSMENPLGLFNVSSLPAKKSLLEAQTSAAVLPLSSAPKGVFTFVNTKTGLVIGCGTRVSIDGTTYMLTARHVMDEIKKFCPGEVVMTNMVKQVPVDMSWSVRAYSPVGSMDFCLVCVPDFVWAALQISALKIARMAKSAHGQVYGVTDGSWSTSFASIKPVIARAGHIIHYASTDCGWSGSPIVSRGHVVGMHLGASTGPHNRGIAMDMLVARNESDQPAWAWKEHGVDEDLEWEKIEDLNSREQSGGDIASDYLFIDDFEVEISSRRSGAFTRQFKEVPSMSYKGTGRAWADYDSDEEWEYQPFEGMNEAATSLFNPGFQQASPRPAPKRPSRTSRVTLGKKDQSKKRESGCDNAAESTLKEEPVSPGVAPQKKHSQHSPASPDTNGPKEEQEPKGDPSSTTAPSSKKDVRRRRKRSRKSKSESSPPTPTPSPEPSSSPKV